MAGKPMEKENPINGIIKQVPVSGNSTVKISSSSEVFCLIVGGHSHYDNYNYAGLVCMANNYSVIDKITMTGSGSIGNYITASLDTDGKTVKITNTGSGTARFTIFCFNGNIDDITVT